MIKPEAVSVAESANIEKVADIILRHLARHVALSITQLSTSLLIRPDDVRKALGMLEKKGLVRRYPDPGYDPNKPHSEALLAWGLSRIIWADVKNFFTKLRRGFLEWLHT